MIEVNNAKRGQIDTADGDDTISLTVYTNNSGWSNNFTINTNDGDDVVTLANGQNSQYTSYSINLGDGNDIIDVAGLNTGYKSASRVVDGGDGIDSITLSGDDTVSFSNFEVINVQANTELTVSAEMLEDNYSEQGLIIAGDISFDSDYKLSLNDLTDAQEVYLTDSGYDADDFSALTVAMGDDTYTILTTDDTSYTFTGEVY